MSRLVLVAVASLCSFLPSQQVNNAGIGGTYLDLQVDGSTSALTNLGVAVDVASGELLVSAASTTPPHRIYRLNGRSGALIGSFAQAAVHNTSTFGIRDMETDGTAFFGGSEAGVTGFTISGAPVTQIRARNGLRSFTPPIAGAALTALGGVVRGLCWDPDANGGNGAFFGVNGQGPIVEFDVQGNVLSTHAAPAGANWHGSGLALDPITGNLWLNGDATSADLVEISRATWTATGRRIANALRDGVPGGLSAASTTQGHHEPWGMAFGLIALTQAAGLLGDPDHVHIHRIHLLPGRLGTDEVVLQNAVGNRPLDTTTKVYAGGATLALRMNDPLGVRTGQPSWQIWNVLDGAVGDSYTRLGVLIPNAGLMIEQRTRNALSIAPSTNFHLSSLPIGFTIQVPLPPNYPVCAGDTIRIQSIYLEPLHPQLLMSTNEAIFVANTNCGITVYAAGANSFNAGTAGFFGVDNQAGSRHGDITRVTLSLIGAAAPNHSMVFDLDQSGMADRFDGGNAQTAGCRGTYRNASDTLCGLDYSAAGNHRIACHTPAENSGFTFTTAHYDAVNQTTKDLGFGFLAFGPGKRFEFNVDTDFGRGITGADMAGMQVTVVTTLSGTLQGLLAPDPADPQRAYVLFQ
ncbi:MAG: hypothetical protein IPK26_29795 [Planctomycetes bacterium]|nr:hypothetical protein [Planctomycetota bacterium]